MVEILVKSFLRHESLYQFIKSVRKFYPEIIIRICDDGNLENTFEDPRIKFYKLPYYSGLGVGKNFLLQQVTTPYFLMCDDDFIFTEDTKIETMFKVLETITEPAIVGGIIRENGELRKGRGHLKVTYSEKEGRRLTRYYYGAKAPTEIIAGIECVPCRMLPTFIMGEKSVFDHWNIHWRDELKRSIHLPFYLDLPVDIKCYSIPSVIIDHTKARPEGYKKYRDNDLYWRMICERSITFKDIYE